MLWNKRMRQVEQAIFYRQIGMMLASGMSFNESLDLIEEGGFSILSRDIVRLKRELSDSDTIQSLLGKHPELFGRFPFELIFGSLDGAQLNRVFQLAADQLDDVAEMRERTTRIFWYPALTFTVGFLVFMLLCQYVLPAFEKMFSDFGGALPAPTQFLLNLGRGINDYSILILLFVATLAVVANRWREMTVKFISHLPLFGTLMKRVQSYFFARNLGTLLAVNVPLGESIRFAGSAVHYGPLGHSLVDSLAEPIGFESLHGLLDRSGRYPQMILQMLYKSVSEEVGVTETMEHICGYYIKEIELAQYRALAVTELLTVALLAFAIGGTVISMYLPIFKLAGTIGG